MPHVSIQKLLASPTSLENVLVRGWVRTRRESRDVIFVEINDGSCLHTLQVVLARENFPAADIAALTTGASVEVEGRLIPSPGEGQLWEMAARTVKIVGPADPAKYPLQKKRHSDEFLRGIAHLRVRTNKYGAMARIRSSLAQAVHAFFHDQGFLWVPTPVITASDCEGAGELFRVTTCELASLGGATVPQPQDDFFGRPAYLTVSGQLAAECLACALGKVYTFGPTFRAENSNTPRHAAEFWMIEPEIAFSDIFEDMRLAEEFIKAVVRANLEERSSDLDLFFRFVDSGLPSRLALLLEGEFPRITHAEAVRILRNAKQAFEFPVGEEMDLQTEHERYLAEIHVKGPVFVYDYPAIIKPFYMRRNDDGCTVAAMDLLVPGVGELVGGSQREERYDVLLESSRRHGLDPAAYDWYFDLRRYGTVPHAGFGLGFERLLMLMTGVSNIRDALLFPRTPHHLEY